MKIYKTRLGALGVLVASLALVTSACGGSSSTGGTGGSSGSGGSISVTFLPKNLGNPYFDTSDKGGKTAVEEFGGTFKEVGPDQASPDAQVPFINTAAQQGTKALVVSANDPKAIGSALNQARQAGTKVVFIDSAVEPHYPLSLDDDSCGDCIAK